MAPRPQARLTRRNPQARLARELLRTEYGLRNRGRGGTNPADADTIWERLLAELRRLMRPLMGGSRSAPGGGGSAPGGGQGGGTVGGPGNDQVGGQASGQGGGSFDQAGPRPGPGHPGAEHPGPQRPVHEGMALLEQRILQLPAHEREAFEDAVLDLVRNDRKYREAFERSPESMPLVARCAANAYEREMAREAPGASVPSGRDPGARGRDLGARGREPGAPGRDEHPRSRWERPAQVRDVPEVEMTPASPRTGFGAPGPDETTDAFGFQEAERAALAERTTGAGWVPREGSVVDGQGFLAAEHAERTGYFEQSRHTAQDVRSGSDARFPARPEWEPPVSPSSSHATPESPLLDLTAPESPLLDLTSPVSPPRYAATPLSPTPYAATPLSPVPYLTNPLSPLPNQAVPVSPLPGLTTPASPASGSAPVPSPINGDGHRALSDALDTFSGSPSPRSVGSPARSRAVVPSPSAHSTPAPRRA
ncbi:hypothetical protein ACFYXJ_28355 [Streptomyces sp. NPDC002667]|uniref:hypothetical protein n=1 Tax=Streptomyces sp. NPDC002667 TaxID=3364657 RepID=UPI00369B1C80